MDEDSVKVFAALLLVTAVVLSYPLRHSQAVMPLSHMHWQDVVDAVGCGKNAERGCSLALAR
jgi:hypothetical protein